MEQKFSQEIVSETLDELGMSCADVCPRFADGTCGAALMQEHNCPEADELMTLLKPYMENI